MSDTRLLEIDIASDSDVVRVRQAARELAERLGFDGMDQTRVATAVSEIARYAGSSHVEFLLRKEGRPLLLVSVTEDARGGGSRGGDVSESGLSATRRLMDFFEIAPEGAWTARITFGKHLPARVPPPSDEALARIAAAMKERPAAAPVDELQQQNSELLEALVEMRAQRTELATLNRELEDTNRGVVALYAELDDRAGYLQRISELKTRFLSNMTHEFRTPLNSMMLLSQILLDRLDGPLTPEQEKQVQLIRRAAEELSDVVNDLLDIAKVEAGKIVVQPTTFNVPELFGALRGMLRPLVPSAREVELVFEDPDPGTLATIFSTDQRKVSQILRNFISNALKYTEQGTVRVSARREPGDTMLFAVSDTGIGIAPEDHERIFDEFVQVDSALQRKVRGTGLGLPLARKLASLLGGSLWVESAPGRGSTFYARIPIRFVKMEAEIPAAPAAERAARPQVLVVTDRTPGIYEALLKDTEFELAVVRDSEPSGVSEGVRPAAIVVDVLSPVRTRALLASFRSRAETGGAPVLLVGSPQQEPAFAGLHADAFCSEPLSREGLTAALRALRRRSGRLRAVIVDDDESARATLRSLLADAGLETAEAAGGHEGLRRIREERPDVVFLDLSMPDLPGEEVLHRLHEDRETQGIPVIVRTGLKASTGRLDLGEEVVAVISKESTSREQALAQVREALSRAGIGEAVRG